MDGRLAILFFAVGLTDMNINDCKQSGCLAPAPAQSALSFGIGDVFFQEKTIGSEIYLRYDLAKTYGPFQPTVGLSVTDSSDIWVGFGATHTSYFWNRPSGATAYTQLHFLPGLYAQGNGPDLGLPLEFRSGAEIGWQTKNGVRLGLSYDHRSNGDISPVNPGLETLKLRVTVPFN